MNNSYKNSSRHKILWVFLCLLVICAAAQKTPKNPNPTASKPVVSPSALPMNKPEPLKIKADQADPKKVYLEFSESLIFDEEKNADFQILTGNVRFRRGGMLMFCDSAYFYEKTNSLDAFGNVRMEQGDTLFVYSDVLFYNGITQLARLRQHVKLENRDVVLFTDSLNYDMVSNIGYYFEGGKITDPTNELTSIYGQYSPDTKRAIFHYDVQLNNPRFILYSDTLEYSTNTRIADIYGPTVIVSDSNTIYTNLGWYNTLKDISMLLDRSLIVNKSQQLTGDTIYYDRNTGFGEAFGNMQLNDTLRKVIMEGQYGFYNEKTEYAFATDSARVIEYSGADSLFLHADTLKAFNRDVALNPVKTKKPVHIVSEKNKIKKDTLAIDSAVTHVNWEGQEAKKEVKPVDTIAMLSQKELPSMILPDASHRLVDSTAVALLDSLPKSMSPSLADSLKTKKTTLKSDSVPNRVLQAYHGARFFRRDMQGVCDSMEYIVNDSALYMYTEPILWNENYQIFGDTIKVFMNDSTVDWAHIPRFAFAAQYKEKEFYDQLSGKDLKAYFVDGFLKRVDVDGNVQTIFYPQEEDSTLTGLNHLESSFLIMELKDQRMEKIKAWPSPQGSLTPIPLVKPAMLYLPDFQWFTDIRPKDKNDIYRKVVKNPDLQVKKRRRFGLEEEE